MTDKIDTNYLEEGDSFEGGPLEQSTFISDVLAAGGTVKIQGNKVFVTSMPKQDEGKAKAASSPKKAAAKAPAKEEAPKAEAPKAEAPKEEDTKAAPKAKAESAPDAKE